MKIGIDLGGTNTVVGLCTDEGKLIHKRSIATKRGNPDGLCIDVRELARAVCADMGTKPSQVCQIGIGVPGSFDKKTTTLTFGPNINMRNVNFSHTFAPDFSCSVHLDNDANCAVLGEYTAGAGRGIENVIMLTLGTGLGGGIIINGKLYTGFNDIAGEMGHMVICFDGAPCNCGRRGCWEVYSSATGMIRLAAQALQETPKSILSQYQAEKGRALTAKIICEARDAGDAVADQVFDQYVAYLACGMNNVIAMMQPERIILGGGVAGYGEKLLRPIQKLVRRDLMQADGEKTEVVLAQLGNDAGIIGAAMLER